jgi:hypothetical protein
VRLVTAFINGLKKIYQAWENYQPALDKGHETSLLGAHIPCVYRGFV